MSSKDTVYYAVKDGKTPGIYTSWKECKEQIAGFPNAKFRKFSTREEAEKFITNTDSSITINMSPLNTGLLLNYLAIDGSFNKKTETYGYGGFLVVKTPEYDKDNLPVIDEKTQSIVCTETKTYPIYGSGSDPEMKIMRNVAGEIQGVKEALKKAMELNLKELTIIYDYIGIEMWATGIWNCNKVGTLIYQDFCKEVMKVMKLTFVKVPGHKGILENELADRIAKYSLNILDKQSDVDTVKAFCNNEISLNTALEKINN